MCTSHVCHQSSFHIQLIETLKLELLVAFPASAYEPGVKSVPNVAATEMAIACCEWVVYLQADVTDNDEMAYLFVLISSVADAGNQYKQIGHILTSL